MIGFGKLHDRDDPKVYNTPNEHKILTQENDTYTKLAEECIKNRICVDLFITIPDTKSIDLTTIAPIATYTGGDLNYFMPFDINKHGEKLHY